MIATRTIPASLSRCAILLAAYGIEAVSAGELGLPEPDETGNHVPRQRRGSRRSPPRKATKHAGLRRRFRPCGRCARRRAGHLLGALGRTGQGFRRGDGEDRAPAARARRHDARASATAHFVSALCVAWPDGHLEEFEARVDGTAGLAAARHRRLRLRPGCSCRTATTAPSAR